MRGLRLGFGVGVGGGIVSAYPSLIMDFVPTAGIEVERSSRTFDQLIDFTRTSSATYVDATGKIVSTPASRNLLTFTQEFDNAAWTKNNVTITSNSTAAPDGTLTAETLTASANAAVHIVTQAGGASGVQQTFSVYAKAGTSSFVQLWHGAAASIYANFNVSTGVVGTVGAGATATISSAGNGWYRCTITCTPGLTNQFRAAMVTSTTAAYAESWPAAGTETIFLWGAQLEAGSAATDYTRNFGGVYPPRFDYDPVTLAPRGLLVEEQRTNLLLRSEEFDNAVWAKFNSSVNANATLSPDGTLTAEKLVEDTSSTSHYIIETFTAANTTTYTLSAFIKAAGRGFAFVGFSGGGAMPTTFVSINLTSGAISIATGTPVAYNAVSFGNGWYRVTISVTSISASTAAVDIRTSNDGVWANRNYAGDGTSGIFVWGAQLEAGAFATSYIPTVASQVTRTADIATITGANFSQFYNQSEGTFVVDADSGGNVALIPIYRVLSAGSGGDAISLFMYNSKWGGAVRVGGVVQADLQVAGTYTANVPAKTSFAFKANDFAASVNGSAVLTDTSGTIPTVAALNLGSEGGSAPLNGHIRSIRYYNTRLSNAQLQALTA